ncbi:MAG: glycosyltransferase family 2 protein [Pseudomonadota bacterium]
MREDARPPRFSVIIVNYNGGDYLKGAIASLTAQTIRDFEVFVVDNASSDGSMDFLFEAAPHFPVNLLPQTENLGFAAGNNLAAEQAKGEWLCLLNPDAEATPDWLEQIGRAAERFPDVASFASAQVDLHNPDRLDGLGDAYLGFGIPWRGGFGRPIGELPKEPAECFSPCGAGAIIRRDIFKAHGGFDERFFCFCEDVDLGYRMRLAGERCVFLPQAIIHHAGGGLSGRVSEFSLYHGARNRLWTYVKNTPLRLVVLTLPGHLALTAAILFRGLFTGRFGGTWRGLWAGLKGLGPFIAERRRLKKRRHISVGEIAAAMCWNPLTMLARKAHLRPLDKDKL